MIVTSIVGMFLATPGMVPWPILIFGNLGIALAASAAAVINHVFERESDAAMMRTKRRPMPTNRVSLPKALVFTAVMAGLSLFLLIRYVNPLAAALTMATLIGYACVYTMFLKRATSQNIVIGGLAGAAPPLLGWVAVTGHVDPYSLLLVLIIFVWTPPHFWALAIHRYEDYKNSDMPMLPVTHGIPYTKLNILLYTILLVVVSILPYVTDMSGIVYLAGALLLGARFLYWAIRLKTDDKSPELALKTFRYSIAYLGLLFLIMLIDHYFFIS